MRIQSLALSALSVAYQCLAYDLKDALEIEAYCSPSTRELEAQVLGTWPPKCIERINQRIPDETLICETSYPVLLHFQVALFKNANACELLVEGEEQPETLIKRSILSLVDKDFGTFERGISMAREYWKLKEEVEFTKALFWIMRYYPTVMEWGPQLRDLLFCRLVGDKVFDNLPVIAEYLYASGRLIGVESAQELQDRLATLEPELVASILFKIGDAGDPGYTEKLAVVIRQDILVPELSEMLSDGGGVDLEKFVDQFVQLLDTRQDPSWEHLRRFFKHQLTSRGFDYTTEMFFSGIDIFDGSEDSKSEMEELLCKRECIAQDLTAAFLEEYPELGKVRTWPDGFCAGQKSLTKCLDEMKRSALAEQATASAVHQVQTSPTTY